MQGYLTHDETLEFNEDYHELNKIPEDERNSFNDLIQLTHFSLLWALYDLVWEPEVNQDFSLEQLMENLKIQRKFQQYIHFFLHSMTKNDSKILGVMDAGEGIFKFMTPPPTRGELEKRLELTDCSREEYKLILEVEKSLPRILSGEIDAIQEIPFKNALEFYESEKSQLPTTSSAAMRIEKHKENAERSYSNGSQSQFRPFYRILEVSGGTGVFTKIYLGDIIPKGSAEIEYFFTDLNLNPADLEKELRDKREGVSLVFRKYDMNEDPLEQGLCPGYFDLIVTSDAFHCAKDITKTMKNLRSLLKPGGLICTTETVCPDERITFIYGLFDGYWEFEDREFRRHHPILLDEMWREVLTEAGFHGISIIPIENNVHALITAYASASATLDQNHFSSEPKSAWIIFGDDDDESRCLSEKFPTVNRKCVISKRPPEFEEVSMQNYMENALREGGAKVNLEGVIYLWSLSPKTLDQQKVSLPFVTLMKLISDFKSPPKVFAVMKGVCPIESSDVIDPSPGTLIGICRSLANENTFLQITFFDLDPNKDTLLQLDELFMNLWVEHKQGQGLAFRDGLRLCPKMTTGKITRSEPLSLPSGCDRYQLILPKTKLISDLEFAYLEPYTLSEREIEVEVKAMALNFRDVFAVLQPIRTFEDKKFCLGIDFTGVVVRVGGKVTRFKVGDRVVGMTRGNISLPSHHKITEDEAHRLSDRLTFAEGATYPLAFCTVILSLLLAAKIKKGDTVLVHTASGGVGLAAIQVCEWFGAQVIATAGSQRKRSYLRNLGIQHVFHSRTTHFKNDILKVTGDRGVDIVLNSLTGPGFKEASLDALGRNGRFIEMSKLNVWTKEEVAVIRPDVFYEIVDATDEETSQDLLTSFNREDVVKIDKIRPLAYERFDALNIRGALNYLQKAKHIGKIVCIMPEVKLEKSKLVATTPLFFSDSTYIVTGGLGGIGYEVVKWMLRKGAKHIVILSRSLPKPEVASQVEAWNKEGKHVKAFSVDVGNHDKLKELLEDLNGAFPPVRGVMHAAGVLQDGVLENQTWDKYTQTYNPKVSGTWNLHDLTKDYLLEHFVLFSSIAATLGTPGQSNHSASNSFEDSFAAYRRSIGLPATCVNWGNWGEVGLATELDVPGVRPIPTTQGLLALETFLTTQTNHMTVFNVDSFSHLLKLFPQVKHYIDSIRLQGDVNTSSAMMMMNSDEFWNEVKSMKDRQGKLGCFIKLVKMVVRNILKMDRDEPIDDQAEFQTLGIDSLMVLEMRNGLQSILGGKMTVSANQLKDCNTTHVLAKTLVDIWEGSYVDKEELESHSQKESQQLVRDDSNLNLNLDALSVDTTQKDKIIED